MNTTKILLPLLIVTLVSGCAAIKVTRPSKPENEQGLKVFPPKPYILMARAGEAGKVISVTPLMLPDLADPHFIRQTVGIGKANLTLAVENGVLKSFGGDVDSKIPEMIKEIGGLATSYGGLVKSLADAGKVREETNKLRRESADMEKLKTAAAKAKSAAGVIATIIKDGTGLSADQISALQGWHDTLLATASALVNPNNDPDQSVLDEHAKKLTTIATDFEKASAGYPEIVRQRNGIATVPAELRAGAKEIASKPAEAAVFELYEVIQQNGATSLRRVPIP